MDIPINSGKGIKEFKSLAQELIDPKNAAMHNQAIMEFGAFVNFLGKQDGLVHISELAPKRVAKVTDVVKEGDEVTVKVIGFDRGKVKLSIKQAVA